MSQEALNAINTAIALEKEGAKHYLKFAKRTRNITGKNMFIQLAYEEIEHMELFEKYREGIEGDSASGAEKAPESVIKVLVEKNKDQAQKAGEGTTEDLEALRIALELEEKSAKFYEEQAEKASNDMAKMLFKELAVIEWGHYELIKYEIDQIENTGYWMDFREFTLE